MPQIPTPAIYFHPDQVEGAGRDLVGRRSAGESFLKGWLRHGAGETVDCVVDTPAAVTAFEAKLRDLGDTRRVNARLLRGGSDFTASGTIFFPAPGFQSAPWRRLRFGPQRCSLVGITHTVSTSRVVESFHHLMSEPVEPWDAIICTSRSVQSVVRKQFEHETEYFRRRFGASRMPLPQLPVIPLGIETADFEPLPGARERLRSAFEVGEDDVVVLTVGRLSVIEKANPVPLMLALERVAQGAGRKVHLWMTGWGRPEEQDLHVGAAAALCPSVAFRLLDGRSPDLRRNVWAAGDIFSLPADSIQETFGLVPIEAMAAGLPVVMPDWDGFRDTVLHNQTGFRVPTRMAAPGAGLPMATRYADQTDGYLQYLALVQSHVQIDVPAYARALSALVANPDLRRSMGAAAQRHARMAFDWKAIIPQYLALAGELAAIRGRTPVSVMPLSQQAISPIEVDPFALYAEYPTGLANPDMVVSPGMDLPPGGIAVLAKASGHTLYRREPVAAAVLERVAGHLRQGGPVTLNELSKALSLPYTLAAGAVLLLAKWDVVRLPQIDPRA